MLSLIDLFSIEDQEKQHLITHVTLPSMIKNILLILTFVITAMGQLPWLEKWMREMEEKAKGIGVCSHRYSTSESGPVLHLECCQGYELNSNELTCTPLLLCNPECANGTCIEKDTCQCNPGYELSASNTTCKPICNDNCPNGLCTAPGECACDSGYEMSDSGCRPICKFRCINGECTAPDICSCIEDYVWNGARRGCEPRCSKFCDENGQCDARNVCVCRDGYKHPHYDSFSCKPQCDNVCWHGECVAPNVCKCDEGFYFNAIEEKCVPLCNATCVNGTCADDEKCVCYDAYTGDNCDRILFNKNLERFDFTSYGMIYFVGIIFFLGLLWLGIVNLSRLNYSDSVTRLMQVNS